jgi:5-methylcytosine-specific restriction protein B
MEFPRKEEYKNMNLKEREEIFKKFLVDEELKEHTINNYIAAIRGFDKTFSYLLEEKRLFEYIDIKIFKLKSEQIEKEKSYVEINEKNHWATRAVLRKYEKFLEQIKIETASKNIGEKMKIFPLNQIFYGPPGTGKTYNTINKALAIIKKTKEEDLDKDRMKLKKEFEDLSESGQIDFITFHQSMSYEDFIEGIKPKCEDNGNVSYKIEDGIFKKICERAEGIDDYKNTFDIVWQKLIEYLEDNDKITMTTKTNKNMEFKLSSTGSLVFLNHSTGKTLTKENIFNAYRGLKGRESGAYQNYMEAVVDYLKKGYDLKEYNKNEIKNSKNYVLIIDEINRGNVSQIFGELITLIEENKRLGKDEELKITLPYSKTEFGVPSNLYIIGTMNTADRSVEALDTALRRRFSFTEMMPDYETLRDRKINDIELDELLKTMNARIEKLLDRDHQIGHSYFLSIKTLNDLKQTFKDKIIPLLQEYFFGDYGKIGLVLGKEFIEKIPETKFADFEYESSELEEKVVYRLKDSDNFKSIYE